MSYSRISPHLFVWEPTQWPRTSFTLHFELTDRGFVREVMAIASTRLDGVVTSGRCSAMIDPAEDFRETLELLCIEAALRSFQPELPGFDQVYRPNLRPRRP